jgi:hypothetical protein
MFKEIFGGQTKILDFLGDYPKYVILAISQNIQGSADQPFTRHFQN